MEIYLIRHGESVGNTKKGFISGRKDKDGLTEKGKAQIIRTAWEFRNLKINSIITSPVVRAKESALIFKKLLQIPLIENHSFTELNHGVFENQYWWEVKDLIPPNWGQSIKEDYITPYPQGESFSQMAKRVYQGLSLLIKEPYKRIIILSHQAIISTIYYIIQQGLLSSKELSINPEKYTNFIHKKSLPNGSIIKLTLDHQVKPVIQPYGKLKTLKLTKKSISFYIQGIMENNHLLSVNHIPTVSGNRVYQITNKKTFIFKILQAKGSLTGSRLVKLYRYLYKKKTIPAPHIVSYDNSNVYFSSPVVIQDFKSGNVQNLCLRNNRHKKLKLFKQIYQAVKTIHQLPIAQVRQFWYPNDAQQKTSFSWVSYFLNEIQKTINIVPQLNLKTKNSQYIISCLEELQNYIKKGEFLLVPLHGDLSPQNIIINHKNNQCQLVRLLDFERARIGDFLWDFVYYYSWLERIDSSSADLWKKTFWNKLTRK